MFPLASENSKDYFNAAIIQSGPLDMGLIRTDQSKTIPEIHKEFVKKVGCRYPGMSSSHGFTNFEATNLRFFSENLSLFIYSYAV